MLVTPIHLRVGQYNVENMFDDVDDPNKADDDMEPKSEASLRAVADTLKKVDADVVALEEVENLEVLKDFLDSYLPGMYPNVTLVEGNDERGIDVAFVSKFPITREESHKDDRFPVPNTNEPGSFRRDLMEVTVQIPNGPSVDLYATHLKAHSGGQPADDLRLAEATQIRKIVAEDQRADPDRFRIVFGDMNDTPPTPPIQQLTKPGEGHLNDALDGKPWSERDSHPTSGKPRRQIDFILYSDNLKEEFVGAQVHRFKNANVASDHYMVSADFNLAPAS
jgi:endonuclease/exonuclease/phosphatase family metal-dependent hydrolase